MERILPALDRTIAICLMVFAVASQFSISVTQIAFAVGTLAWLIKTGLTKEWQAVRWPLWMPFAAYCLAAVLAVALAYDPAYSVKSLKKLPQILIFFWVLNSIRDARQRDFLVLLLIGSASAAALYGFYQSLMTEVTLATRVAGTMSIYMTFAGLLMLTGLLAAGRLLFKEPREPWLALAVAVILVCLLLTLTRQAWLGFCAGAVFLVYFWRRIWLWAIPVTLALAFVLSPPAVKQRILSMTDLSDWTVQSRLALWRGGVAVVKDYPVTGCGFRCMDLVHPNYPDPTGYIATYRGMHNNAVQVAVDTGLLGLTAWLSIWAAYYWNLFRRQRDGVFDAASRWVVMGSAAAVTGFLAGGMFEVNFYDSEVVMVLYFILALPFAAGNGKQALA